MQHDPIAPAMRIAGATGFLRFGYQRAARVGSWTVELTRDTPREFRCRAEVSEVNEHWMAENDGDGLDLALHLGSAELLWRGLRVDVSDGVMTATLRERPIVTDYAPIADRE